MNQQILFFWYVPPESNQQIIFVCYPPPELTQKRSFKIKEPGKNRERTVGFFLKTVGSLRVLKYPELTGTLILILKKYPEPASSLILVFWKTWNRRFFGNSNNHTILRISHGHISTWGQNWISHYKLTTVPSSKIQCTRQFIGFRYSPIHSKLWITTELVHGCKM